LEAARVSFCVVITEALSELALAANFNRAAARETVAATHRRLVGCIGPRCKRRDNWHRPEASRRHPHLLEGIPTGNPALFKFLVQLVHADLLHSCGTPIVRLPNVSEKPNPVNTSPAVFGGTARGLKLSIRILAGVDDATGRIGPPPVQILETEIDGEISLYNPHSEAVLVLNPTASDVWRLSDGEHTLEEMVRLLAAAYQVRPEDIRRDVEQAVRNIIEEGFLPE